jgi:hypothetical protein
MWFTCCYALVPTYSTELYMKHERKTKRILGWIFKIEYLYIKQKRYE